MRISDWSSDVCSSDLPHAHRCRLAKSIGARAILLAADTDEQDYEGIDTHDIARLADRASRLDAFQAYPDGKRVVSGKSVAVRVDLGGRRISTNNNTHQMIKYRQWTKS